MVNTDVKHTGVLENSLISQVVFKERHPDKCCIYNVIQLSYNIIYSITR